MNTKEKQKYKDNLTNNNHKQRKSLIAYFDILGYKEMIKTNYIPENILIGEIERITKDVYKTTKFSIKGKSKWNVYSFSDNYAIVINYHDEGFIAEVRQLVWILTIIQCQFLSLYGIIIRGAVVNGMVYAGSKFIYGEGLIRAYEIENSMAIYPRIVIDSELIKECFQLIKNMFYKPISLKGQIYNPELLDELNMLQLFPKFLFGLVYDSGKTDSHRIDKWLEEDDDDAISICKDFDDQYYIDYFNYIIFLKKYPNIYDDDIDNEEESIMDLHIQGLTFHLLRYIDTFGSENKLLKKYLWMCIKANNIINKVGYNNIFNKTNILKLCKIDLRKEFKNDDILELFIQEIPDN